MSARCTSSAPQSPHPGASRAAGGAPPPPASEGAVSENWETFWSIVAGLFAGVLIGIAVMYLLAPTAVDLLVKVLLS